MPSGRGPGGPRRRVLRRRFGQLATTEFRFAGGSHQLVGRPLLRGLGVEASGCLGEGQVTEILGLAVGAAGMNAPDLVRDAHVAHVAHVLSPYLGYGLLHGLCKKRSM